MATRQDLANAIRALSMDAVQKANSGHPGAPMGMAEIAEVLWNHHLQHNPSNPNWANRDRFILSNGHGSMLIYSLLHLTGYDLPMDEIKTFRQLHSKCAGHPEYGYAPGVETTTGPLGQGISNAVGFAMAEKLLANQFNKPNHKIVDHHTYVFLGDGCMMEGVSHEASALAGTWGLGNLIAFWDDNGISIDGHIEGWYTDDTAKRFESYGWHVIPNVDGHDFEAINKAVEAAKKITDKPSLICCKTIIGKGSPNKSGKASKKPSIHIFQLPGKVLTVCTETNRSSKPQFLKCSGSTPRSASSGSQALSKLMNTKPAQVSQGISSRPNSASSICGKSQRPGISRNEPSKCQAMP